MRFHVCPVRLNPQWVLNFGLDAKFSQRCNERPGPPRDLVSQDPAPTDGTVRVKKKRQALLEIEFVGLGVHKDVGLVFADPPANLTPQSLDLFGNDHLGPYESAVLRDHVHEIHERLELQTPRLDLPDQFGDLDGIPLKSFLKEADLQQLFGQFSVQAVDREKLVRKDRKPEGESDGTLFLQQSTNHNLRSILSFPDDPIFNKMTSS